MIDEARKIIEPLAYQKAATIGKKISKIDLRDTKSRWGSCSTDKRLMLSWRLIMAPPEILDYVVAHEVAHLKHMDHSKKFWDLCYELANGDGDYARQWLKDNGNNLMRYF
jgi:predicted metal-dependent hydrolase